MAAENRFEGADAAPDSTPAEWARDLLESDRRYFEAGAEVIPVTHARIAVLSGARSLAAGCVVHRVDAPAAADLLGAKKPELIRRSGNPDCVLCFYDATRNHRRQWCAMGTCGNLMKVRAFRRRHRRRPQA